MTASDPSTFRLFTVSSTWNSCSVPRALWSKLGQSSKLLLALASTIILGSGSSGTHGRILLYHDSGSLVSLLIRLTIKLMLVLVSTVRTPSGAMTKFVPIPFMCSEMGSPLRREEGLVFLSMRHICCSVIQHGCTHPHGVFG
jgi:hypothetical protein